MTGEFRFWQASVRAAALTGGLFAAASAAPFGTAHSPPTRALTLRIERLDGPADPAMTLGTGLLESGGTERRWRLSLAATLPVERPSGGADPAPRAGPALVLGHRHAPQPAPASPLVSALVFPGRTGNLFPLDPLERAVLGEMERARSYGGPHNWSRPAFLVSIPGLVKVIREAVQAALAGRLPEGARARTGRTLRVLALEDSGSTPEAVTVIPLVLGWVGSTAGGPCDAGGTCEVTALPDGAFTGLVIGDGAALVDVPAHVDVVVARLRPLGLIRLMRPVDGVDMAVRIVDGVTRLAVPTHPSLNHGRGEWVRVRGIGATVLAPAGDYVVEARADATLAGRLEVTVLAGATTTVTLPAPR